MSECPSWFVRNSFKKSILFSSYFYFGFKKKSTILTWYLKKIFEKVDGKIQWEHFKIDSFFKNFCWFWSPWLLMVFKRRLVLGEKLLHSQQILLSCKYIPATSRSSCGFKLDHTVWFGQGRQSCREPVGAAERGHCWALGALQWWSMVWNHSYSSGIASPAYCHTLTTVPARTVKG